MANPLRARERMLLIIGDNGGLEEDKIRKAFGEQHPDVSRSSPFLIDQLTKLGHILGASIIANTPVERFLFSPRTRRSTSGNSVSKCPLTLTSSASKLHAASKAEEAFSRTF